MNFEQLVSDMVDDSIEEDSQDFLDCYGEFSKLDKMCTCYCAASIQCAVERGHNPKIDLFDQLMSLNYFPARMQ